MIAFLKLVKYLTVFLELNYGVNMESVTEIQTTSKIPLDEILQLIKSPEYADHRKLALALIMLFGLMGLLLVG